MFQIDSMEWEYYFKGVGGSGPRLACLTLRCGAVTGDDV